MSKSTEHANSAAVVSSLLTLLKIIVLVGLDLYVNSDQFKIASLNMPRKKYHFKAFSVQFLNV